MADYKALAKELTRRRAKKPIVPQQPQSGSTGQRELFMRNVLKR